MKMKNLLIGVVLMLGMILSAQSKDCRDYDTVERTEFNDSISHDGTICITKSHIELVIMDKIHYMHILEKSYDYINDIYVTIYKTREDSGKIVYMFFPDDNRLGVFVMDNGATEGVRFVVKKRRI